MQTFFNNKEIPPNHPFPGFARTGVKVGGRWDLNVLRNRTMKNLMSNKGISLIVLIVIMLGMALIGGGVAAVMSSKQKSYPFALNSFKAYEIANAGAEAAIMYGKDIVFDPSDNAKITLLNTNLNNKNFGGGTFTANYAAGTLTSTGIYNNVSRVVTLANFAMYASTEGVPFSEGMIGFDFPVTTEDDGGDPNLAIRVDTIAQTIGLGQLTYTYRFGAIWYGGNYSGGGTTCTDGKCDFGKGIRAFFLFSFLPGSLADGFVFALTNGTYNDKTSVGGDSRLGELMAFAGDSRSYDASGNIMAFRDRKEGRGLRPPKMGVEFDTWNNEAGRNDILYQAPTYNPRNHHMAYVFWGDTSDVVGLNVTTYTPWQQTALFSLNRVVDPSTSTYLYRVTTAGASGATQPTWPIGKGNTVADGTVTWTECSWRASFNGYSIGDVVVPNTANGYYYTCSARYGAGTTSGGEPAWPTTLSNAVDDGAIVTNVTGSDGNTYSCIANHTSRNDNKPTTGANWATYWVKGGSGGSAWRNNQAYIASNYVTWQNTGTILFPGNSSTYDDNRHGAGGTGTNPANLTTAGDYFSPYFVAPPLGSTSGLVGPVYAFRMEVIRPTTTDMSGFCTTTDYKYRLMSWLKNCDNTGVDTGCSAYIYTALSNVNVDYNPIFYPPTLDRSICLSPADHANYNKFLFGWTEATGAGTQNATISKFKLNFRY